MTDVMLGPTRERLAKAPTYDDGISAFDVPVNTPKRKTPTFRLMCVIEAMLNDGKLKLFQFEAFHRFERDFTAAHRSVGIPGYGERISAGGGTPLSQLTTWLLNVSSPEDRRLEAARDVSRAAQAVGSPKAVSALVLVATEPIGLEDIGARVLAIRNKPQARSAAGTLIDLGTFLLARHYGYTDAPISAAPRPG